MSDTDGRKTVNRICTGHEAGEAVLLKVKPTLIDTALADFFAVADAKDVPLVYIAAKRPYATLHQQLEDRGIADASFRYIDCISEQYTGEELPDSDRVFYAGSPAELGNIGTLVNVAANQLSGEGVIVLDSIPTLAKYNAERKVVRFLQNLKERAGTIGMTLVLFKQEGMLEAGIGTQVYNLVDTFLFYGDIDHVTARIQNGEEPGRYLVSVPADVFRSLAWEPGDRLMLTVSGDRRIILQPEPETV